MCQALGEATLLIRDVIPRHHRCDDDVGGQTLKGALSVQPNELQLAIIAATKTGTQDSVSWEEIACVKSRCLVFSRWSLQY